MKRLFFISVVFLISISGFAQKRTSQDILKDVQLIIGNNRVEMTPALFSLVYEFNKSQMQESRQKPVKDIIVNNPGGGGYFCFTCQCACGCIYTQGNCANYPRPCSDGCSCCGNPRYTVYISLCQGGMCGNIQGAN
jgi:hypothetical protein